MKISQILFIVILLAFFAYPAIAQEVNWQKINGAEGVFDIVINANDHIFILTADSIYRSTDQINYCRDKYCLI